MRLLLLSGISILIQCISGFAQYDNGSIIYNQTSGTNLTSISKNYIVEDFDGDFNADVIMVKSNTANNAYHLTWYKGNGSGNFTPQNNIISVNSSHRKNEIFYADMNEDGNKDIVFQNSDTGFKILLNDGQGNISTQINNEVTIDNTLEADLKELADLDGDGDMDCIFCTIFNENVFGTCLIGYNNGGGMLSNYTYLDEDELDYHLLIETGDIDGDGKVDIVSSGYSFIGQFLVKLYKNTGTNSFSVGEGITIPITAQFANIKVKDIDNNGIDEILIEVTNFVIGIHQSSFIDDRFHVFSYNNQTETFIRLANYNSWFHSYNIPSPSTNTTNELYNDAFHIQFGNQNTDNDLDILGVNAPLGRLQWYLGDGIGNFNNTQTVTMNSQYSSIPPILRVADIDNDTDLDVFVLLNDNTSSNLTVFKNLALSPLCPPVLDLTNNTINNGVYQADITTISSGNIEVGNTVLLKAGTNVRLNSGFRVPVNTRLKVAIDPCN